MLETLTSWTAAIVVEVQSRGQETKRERTNTERNLEAIEPETEQVLNTVTKCQSKAGLDQWKAGR